jgi:single-strand DNA-binding protein
MFQTQITGTKIRNNGKDAEMALGETTTSVVGTVVSDLMSRTLSGNVDVVSFWMRSNERRRDRGSGEWIDGRHFSVKVTCWRKLAVSTRLSLKKGDPVIVSGRLHSSDYESEGKLRSITELEALALGPNLARCTASVTRADRAQIDHAQIDRGQIDHGQTKYREESEQLEAILAAAA